MGDANRKGGFGGWNVGSALHLLLAVFLSAALTVLNGPAALAQPSTEVHMSVSPGGGVETAIRSGTAKVFAVLRYEELPANTPLKVSIFGAGGVPLFEQSDVYSGSGQVDIEITGRDAFSGYVSAAHAQSDALTQAIDLAQESTTAHAKRGRTGPVINAARTLELVLSVLKNYDLPLKSLDHLDDAQAGADDIETRGYEIINGEVSDDELDAALGELEALASEIADTVDLALEDVDTERERPWLDGSYTTTLKQEDLIKDGFDWEVRPDGAQGTSVPPTLTPTRTPTGTLLPSRTPEPTATETVGSGTATAQPTSTPTVPATATAPSSGGEKTTPTPTTRRQSGSTPTTGPIVTPPTATPGSSEPAATAEPVTDTPGAGVQAINPTVDSSELTGPSATPVAQALARSEGDRSEEVPNAERESSAAVLEIARETPLAPQEVDELPVTRILALLSALTLGIVALWLRARI